MSLFIGKTVVSNYTSSIRCEITRIMPYLPTNLVQGAMTRKTTSPILIHSQWSSSKGTIFSPSTIMLGLKFLGSTGFLNREFSSRTECLFTMWNDISSEKRPWKRTAYCVICMYKYKISYVLRQLHLGPKRRPADNAIHPGTYLMGFPILNILWEFYRVPDK